jgi:hypothetical protein
MLRRLFLQEACRAASRACCTAGSSNPINVPMIAITTTSSTSVKPRLDTKQPGGRDLTTRAPATCGSRLPPQDAATGDPEQARLFWPSPTREKATEAFFHEQPGAGHTHSASPHTACERATMHHRTVVGTGCRRRGQGLCGPERPTANLDCKSRGPAVNESADSVAPTRSRVAEGPPDLVRPVPGATAPGTGLNRDFQTILRDQAQLTLPSTVSVTLAAFDSRLPARSVTRPPRGSVTVNSPAARSRFGAVMV